MRGILYEAEQWVATKPIGEQEWDVHHVQSTAEGETERFLEEKGDVGDRATYMRLGMFTTDTPFAEPYQTVKDELKQQGPSFMKGEHHVNGRISRKEPSRRTTKSA